MLVHNLYTYIIVKYRVHFLKHFQLLLFAFQLKSSKQIKEKKKVCGTYVVGWGGINSPVLLSVWSSPAQYLIRFPIQLKLY